MAGPSHGGNLSASVAHPEILGSLSFSGPELPSWIWMRTRDYVLQEAHAKLLSF
jgi:hypothetical protein